MAGNVNKTRKITVSNKQLKSVNNEINQLAKALESGNASAAELDTLWAKILETEDKAVNSLQKQHDAASSLAKTLENAAEQEAKRLDYEKEIDDLQQEIKQRNALYEKQIEKQRSQGTKEEAKKLEKEQKNFNKSSQAKLAAMKAEHSLSVQQMREQDELRKQYAEAEKAGREEMLAGLKTGHLGDAWRGFKTSMTGGASGGQGAANVLSNLSNSLAALGKKLDKSIEEIVSYKSDWDTRLFGSNTNYKSLVDAVSGSLGASPFVKQSKVLENINTAISDGIAFNVEQRAFLQTIKDDIAGTFDAFDSTLLEIIRIQQKDSTAARLGMEASLNSYLNNMYENTEYLSKLSDSVTSSLYQATSLLGAEQSIGFEYQVQKWLGSLYSVGMSSSAISNIATAIGQLASGDVSGTTSGAGKLLVMAASRAGLPYDELLTKGINDSEMNSLMQEMVRYLQQIANSNRVVQAQYAGVYGLSTSDIIAAGNIGTDVDVISRSSLNNAQAMGTLQSMAKTIGSRMATGELIKNAIDNFEYTIASQIAGSGGLYTMWAITNLLDEYLGGVAIPTISVMGSSVDLNTTVANLMRTGTMVAGMMSGIGKIIGAASGMTDPWQAFTKLGINSGMSSVTRGTGYIPNYGQITTSASNLQGNAAGGDIYDASLATADEEKEKVKNEAKDENEDQTTLGMVNESIINIIDLLNSVIDGGNYFNVRVSSLNNDASIPEHGG